MSKQDALRDLGLPTVAPSSVAWLSVIARAYVNYREVFWWCFYVLMVALALTAAHVTGEFAPLFKPFGASLYVLLPIYMVVLYRRLGAEIASDELRTAVTLLVIIPLQSEYLGIGGGVVGKTIQGLLHTILCLSGADTQAVVFVGLMLSSGLTVYALVLSGFPLLGLGQWLWNGLLSLMLSSAEQPALTNPASRRAVKVVAPVAQPVATALTKILESHGVAGAEEVGKKQGPVITRHLLRIPAGTKLSKLSVDDISRDMRLGEGQWVALTANAGNGLMGIDVPNAKREVIDFARLLKSSEWGDAVKSYVLPMLLGVTIDGLPIAIDLAKMPHLLVAGTSGSGKSVLVNVMLLSLMDVRPKQQVELILIDPKKLEFGLYEDCTWLAQPVITVMDEAAVALQWCVDEMERRETLFQAHKVKNIAGYNAKVSVIERKPYLVVVVDEFADLMLTHRKTVEGLVARLAQKARATGIHLILATQRPDADTFTGLILSNVANRIALLVGKGSDSDIALGERGAEKLLGNGDALLKRNGLPITRFHGALIPDDQIERWVK